MNGLIHKEKQQKPTEVSRNPLVSSTHKIRKLSEKATPVVLYGFSGYFAFSSVYKAAEMRIQQAKYEGASSQLASDIQAVGKAALKGKELVNVMAADLVQNSEVIAGYGISAVMLAGAGIIMQKLVKRHYAQAEHVTPQTISHAPSPIA